MPRKFSHYKAKARKDGGSIVTSHFTDGSYVKRLYDARGHYVTTIETKASCPEVVVPPSRVCPPFWRPSWR